MAEIEIKARVQDRAQVIKNLNEKAKYLKTVIKDDTYYGKSIDSKIKIRIRKEQHEDLTQYLVTYKKKENHVSDNGTVIEVNDEKECTISDPQPLHEFLLDSGNLITLKKHKEVMDWTLPVELPDLPPLSATFELCTVPPLGDFLEIEIISPYSDEKTVAALNKTLEELLYAAGLTKNDIEEKYYSQLLREWEQLHGK